MNDTYFNGNYKDIWRTTIPEELTVKETDFILSYFNLQPGSKILDLMCGYGRHALALARKGMLVTAVDNLGDYINEIKENADREQLPLKAVQHDILTYRPDDVFDLVICMGNSMNFFNAEDTSQLLATISSHLKKGGHLLLNTWALAEIAIKNFNPKTWSTIGELKCLNDSKFLFHPTRIETETIIIDPDGNTENRTAIDYIFSVNEMENMLKKMGLSLTEIYSIPGKRKFVVGEPRAYLVAKK